MASIMYNKGLAEIMNGGIDLDGDSLKLLLVTTAYTADKDHDFVNDVSGSEVSVSGYARQTLASKTVTADNTNDRGVFDAADVSFSALTAGQTIGGAVIFEDRGGADSANPVICFIDLADTATNGATLTITWSANGIFYIG